MELRDIEYFAMAAEHGHLGRAAEALGLSQPALSKSLRRLEAALKVKLVKRTAKGVEPTAEGAALLSRVRELRLMVRNVAREIAEVSEGRTGQLRIGLSMAVSETFLSKTFAAVMRDAPSIRLNVSISDNDLMIPALLDGELDVIVNYGRPHDTLVSEFLYDDAFVVCAARRHRLAGRETVTLAELAQERWALSEPTLISQRWLLDRFREAGLPPLRVGFESRSVAFRLRTVACSDLLTFASRSLIRESAASNDLAVLPAQGLSWPFPVSATYRRDAYVPPALRRFIAIIKDAAQATTPGA
jgi:DNA-binding transcriptional LysR family regulator